MFSLLLAGASFTSCSKDDLLDVPELDNPVVTVYNADASGNKTTEITAPITASEVGTVVPIVVRFDMGAQEDKLTKVKITTKIGTQSFTVLDSTLNDGWFNGADKFHEEKFKVIVGQTPSTITFETVDKKNRVGTATITVGREGMVSPKAQRVVLLAGQLNTTAEYGGFYSVATDKQYKPSEAVLSAQYIDFVFYYGNKNAATIAPISDEIFRKFEVVNGVNTYVGPTGYYELVKQFAVKNPTEFAVASADNYTKGTMPGGTFVAVQQTNLQKDDYRAFKTVLGQKGIFRVVSIDGTDGSNRSITLDLKVIQ